ncbi:lipopolysaccharide biosynthesis protein [uncultured Draconibacterium sp.]|uniref:lipopolysaccharide biosynthesis protein n=1 Tax=uncultured Draconibacterium sp. TaxID=1573823 RepID=UPI003217D83E
MTDNLKDKAARGIVWKFLDQGGTQLIQFISGIYIARILSPEDYGLVGMLAIFFAISQVFIDSGFKTVLIQKGTEVTQDDYNVVFYFNVGISIFFYLLIFFTAPLIARFFDEPRLVMIARVLGLSLVFSSLSIVHYIMFEKKLNFRTITKVKLVAILFSVVVGIGLATYGYGVWALVFMMLTEVFVRTFLLWILNKWYPSYSFKIKIFKALFSKGAKVLLAGILGQLNLNMFSFVIGKFYTTADVGFYSQGRKLQQRIGDFIVNSIFGVMFPVLSLIKDDIPRLRNSVRTNVKVTSLVAFPAIIGILVIAEPFIQLFLTEKWLPSVYYLEVLSVAGLFVVLSGSVGGFILALGKFNLNLSLNVFNTIMLIVIIGMGLFFNVSLKQLMLGKILQEAILLGVIVFYSKRIIAYGVFQLFIDAFPAFLFSILMGIVVIFIGKLFGISFIVLGLQVISGILIYVMLNFIFNRKMIDEILRFSKSLIR